MTRLSLVRNNPAVPVRLRGRGRPPATTTRDQHEVEIQGVNYLVMRERDLHAIANERPEHGTGLYL
jgi:hypothetical protein